MLGGAYSSQYKTAERQHVETIKTFAENDKADAIARARKLSIETNKRRRALAIKRKTETDREEKRRKQILAKRRERQKDATERFQRAGMPARPDSGSSGKWSPHHGTTSQLEDALKIVRGSPSMRSSSARTRDRVSPTQPYYRQNSAPVNKPYFNKYAHPSVNNQGHNGHGSHHSQREDLHNKSLRNLHNSRSLFEQQLETHQQSLLEQQQKSLREFNKQVMREIELEKNVVNGEPYNDGRELVERSDCVSPVDSLDDTGSNDTLRESCELSEFMQKQNGINSNGIASGNGSKKVSFVNEGNQENGKNRLPSAGNSETQNIDSYNTQVQATVNSGQNTQDQKQLFYQQRQHEIQQQLQEQLQQQLLIQQKQQQELQQRVLDQQKKQQQMLEQQFQKQQQEQLEKQKQQEQLQLQEQLLEAQKKQQQLQEAQKQQLLLESQQKQQQQVSKVNPTANEDEKENHRPKAQMKAWATPSPHPPPTPASIPNTTGPNSVTHTSPYTGKNTHTNVTKVTTYNKMPEDNYNSNVNSKFGAQSANTAVNQAIMPQQNQFNNSPANLAINSNELSTESATNKDKGVSFLDTIANGLTRTPNTNTNSSLRAISDENITQPSVPSVSVNSNKVVPQTAARPTTSRVTGNTTGANITAAKPPPSSGYYVSSYASAYADRKQQTTNGAPVATAGKNSNEIKMNNGSLARGTLGFVEGQLAMLPDPGVNGDEGQDTADTDSISTICEEREPEPKEIRSILKRTGKKGNGVMKKAGSTGNMRDTGIRDSLEITRVHLQTSADEKEQRPTKKNVRFADLTYPDEPEDDLDDSDEQDKLFVRRPNVVHQKPPRPVSAVAQKTVTMRVDSKPPRASSATVRTSSIPRAKTQIVRPQATAHIITQGPTSSTVNMTSANEMDKKVVIVNSNFMEKVPARVGNTVSSVTPASVYSVTSVNYSRPAEQKVNYAVSSIVMPKSDSAPFIYPNYTKQGPSPVGSSNNPSQTRQNGSKYDGAVFDDNGLRIDRTPTDDEINYLWDKVRTCLSRNSEATPDKMQPPVSMAMDSPSQLSRQAAPVSNTYIDGKSLGQYNSMSRVAQQPAYNNSPQGVRRQNSLENNNNTYAKRYGLLQQRKQQPNPNSLKSRQQQQQQGYTKYHAPVQSPSGPQATVVAQNNQDVTESMAGFLAAEQLAEQSVSESKIQQAMEDAQIRQQTYNAGRPSPKVKSALSMEEQRLLESLDRLNDKLRVTESSIPNNSSNPQHLQQQQQQEILLLQQQQQQQQTPQQVLHVGGFKGHTPISQRRVIEASNNKGRLRITSATLNRNTRRQQ